MKLEFVFRFLVMAIMGHAIVGCSRPVAPPATPGPLSVEEWREIKDVYEKYDPATFDRLKEGNPKLQSDAAWDQFMKDVVIPERKVDIKTEL